LSVKLKYLSAWTERRIEIANYYSQQLKGVKHIILPTRQDWAKQVYHLFVIRTDKRDELQQYLKDNSIQTGIHYPISLPKLKAYDYTGQASEDFFANKSDVNLLSLPISEHLFVEDLEKVVSNLKQWK